MSAKAQKQIEKTEVDLQRLEKKLRAAEVNKEEVDSKTDSVSNELNMINNELVKAKRLLDENTVDRDTADKRKKNLDIEVRHLVALKAQKYKEIRNLQTTLTSLEWKLNECVEAQKKHEDQTARDLASIEKSRSQLEFQKVYNSRKLENEQRSMQAKFLTAKQELNRGFQRDFEEMKQHYELLISDMTTKHKAAMDAVDSKQGAKIAQLKSENMKLRREYDGISLDIKVEGEKQRRLAKQLEREQLISEVNQTNDVSWVNKADVTDTSRRSALIDMEKVLNDLRQRSLEEGDEYNVANQQRLATQKALRKAKQEVAEHQALLQHLEASKKDMERRLNKRVSELQGAIERATKKLADEHNTKKASLQVECDSRVEEAKSLAKQCADMEAELVRNSSSTGSMASRLDEKLQAEREHVHQLETEKRESEVKVRLVQFDVDSLRVKLTEMEQEVNRLKARVDMTAKELQQEEDKNHQLEVTVKQLEAKNNNKLWVTFPCERKNNYHSGSPIHRFITMAFSLPPLPYSKNALEPHISSEIIEYHYEKHHRGYVTKLNALTKDTPLSSLPLESLVRTEQGKIFNMAAQVWNHTMYWECMSPNSRGVPSENSEILKLIIHDFGSFDAFKDQFTDLSANHFGSGWVWLVQDNNGRLSCRCTHDAGNPMTDGYFPLLTLDVWEHSYYLQYRHDRLSYIKSWWELVNWNYVEERLRRLSKL